MKEVVIRVQIGDDYMEIPYSVPKRLNEDETFEECVSYVMSNIEVYVD